MEKKKKSFIYYWVNKDWNNVLPWEGCRAEKRGTCAVFGLVMDQTPTNFTACCAASLVQKVTKA